MTRGTDSYSEPLLTPRSASPIDTSPASALSPQTETLQAEGYDRGTGLITMHSSLMPFADPNTSQPHRKFAYLTRTSACIPKREYPVTPAALAEGVEVLRSLLEFNTDFPELLNDECEIDAAELCGWPLFKVAWRATQNTLRWLGTRPSLDQLTSTALAIFQQTACPLELPISAENDALEHALSGLRLRWETIGICFIRIGVFVATGRTHAGQGFFHGRGQQSIFDRQRAMLKAFDACMQTRAFCGQVEQTNDLTLWLLASVFTLATWCFGDDSSRAWCLMGDLASAITALGLHRGVKADDSPPYLVELRKRVIALAHEQDKGVATFVGRPPHLSQRYHSVDLPLDLPDSVIMGSVEKFEAARAKLDENGWSRDVMVKPVSRLRAALLLSMIREEVLELSLGPPVPNIAQQARQILSKLTSTWESIPHREYEQPVFDTMVPIAIWAVIGPRLEYLYTKFLLHKLLISQNEGNRDKMIQTSHEILHLTLLLLKKNDIISTPNLEWTMVFYAMPCASVLILELFRQNRQHHQTATMLNRSTLIQDISVLISCCDSLAISGQSNYQICKQAQMVFSRCLDQILNPYSSNTLTSEPGAEEVQQQSFALGSMDFGLTELYPQDPEWSAWLESFDAYEA